MRNHRRHFIAACLLLSLSSLVKAEDLFIEVESEGMQKMDIAVNAFKVLPPAEARKLPADPSKVIANDMRLSGRFNVTEVTGIDTAMLRSKAIPVVADGRVGTQGGMFVLECLLNDARTLNKIAGKEYQVKEKEYRRACHLFSDEAVFRLFGEKGVASTRIVCAAQFGKAKEICLVDADGQNLVRITGNNQLNLSPCLSPDNKTVVYTSYRQGTPALYATGIYTGETRRLTPNGRLNISPTWNAADGRIAFSSSITGDGDIYTMEPDGTDLKRLTVSPTIEASPCYSPNGYEIAFTSDRTGGPQIYIMDNEGGNVRRLTFDGSYNDSPAFSPKGDKIAYTSLMDGHFDICTIELDGSGVKRLTEKGGNNEHPSFSPDGRLIVFTSTRSGSNDLYVMNVDGSNQTRITFSGILSSPVWSGYYE